ATHLSPRSGQPTLVGKRGEKPTSTFPEDRNRTEAEGDSSSETLLLSGQWPKLRDAPWRICWSGNRITAVPASSLVGAPGFEPGTSCPPDKRANQAAPRPVDR